VIADHPMLSLAELEQHDPRPTGHGAERRFLCPFPACADHQRHEHKNLAANIESGLWECKRCGASGKLTEKWERPQPRARVLRVGPYEKARRALGLVSAPVGGSHQGRAGAVLERSGAARTPAHARTDQDNHVAADTRGVVPTWRRRWDQAVPVAGTPGETYLASRGIPVEIATAAGVRYLDRWGHWTRNEDGEWHLEGTSRRVVFPIVDKVGELIGIQGRKIAAGEQGEKMLTNGHGGIFVAGAVWPLDQVECVAIVEAPIDALSLAAAGIPALATQGTSCPDWLPLALAFKSVLLAHDNDEPDGNGQRAGDMAAAGLVPALRSYGAEPERWRPRTKDWNQDLQDLGLEGLHRMIAGESVSELMPAAVEITVEHSSASLSELVPVVPETRVEATMDAYPGAQAVEQHERAEVDELLGWLSEAELPHEPFQLWPWQRVVEVARFVVMLQTELAADVIGPRWRGAAEDLRQLARLYRDVANRSQPATGWSARQSRAPPVSSNVLLLMADVRIGADEPATRHV
jgi:hypothetical protein